MRGCHLVLYKDFFPMERTIGKRRRQRNAGNWLGVVVGHYFKVIDPYGNLAYRSASDLNEIKIRSPIQPLWW